jgi:cytochrome c
VKNGVLAGSMILAACAPMAPQHAANQLAAGERAYQKCYSCHALEAGKNDLTGPTLYDVVGRQIAAEPGYDYSPALRGFAQREHSWGRNLLDKFIADPEGIVPGTSMIFHGIADPGERAALVAYLESNQTRASAASLP